ncbi:uncharacterized protein LOC119596757 [Penaeus monodon]|uniref:uncharacterized protein LOC119596757 n=1 Tax=Penaeus monodon TaxID=6687 RepID=UPI0018A6DEB9|nr:uncharacterized protein LOC119596757 [Penaeus monodon]
MIQWIETLDSDPRGREFNSLATAVVHTAAQVCKNKKIFLKHLEKPSKHCGKEIGDKNASLCATGIYNYGKTALNTFRRTEKLSFRPKKLQRDIRFPNLCKNYDVTPRFVNFRVHNPLFTHTQTYRSWCRVLLNREITVQTKKETSPTVKLNDNISQLKTTLSSLDFICIFRIITNNVNNKLRRVDSIHNKKLLNLGINVQKKVNKDKVIFNFSDRILTEEQKGILSLGLDYCLPPTKATFHLFYLHFDKLCKNLKNCNIYKNSFNNVTYDITIIANTTFKKFSRQVKQTCDSEAILSPLKTLKNDKTILITKPDKGRGVVILNSCDYKQKILNILSDHTKFKRITTEVSTHLLYLEVKLKLLRIIKTSVNESTYNFLMTSGSIPGLLYGLPKVHKPNIPLRLIISSIGTFNYNTAKFLVPIISPLTTNQYKIENSTTFVNEITSLTFQQAITMVLRPYGRFTHCMYTPDVTLILLLMSHFMTLLMSHL